jgi:hypothetical protein
MPRLPLRRERESPPARCDARGVMRIILRGAMLTCVRDIGPVDLAESGP